MKLIFAIAVLIAFVTADVSEIGQEQKEYLPPSAAAPAEAPFPFSPEQPSNEYIPPEGNFNNPEPAPAHSFSDDGYRYKTVRRIRYRHRI